MADIAQQYSLRIINNVGKIVKSIHCSKSIETIDVSKLPGGVYHVCITDETGGKTTKDVVITH